MPIYLAGIFPDDILWFLSVFFFAAFRQVGIKGLYRFVCVCVIWLKCVCVCVNSSG